MTTKQRELGILLLEQALIYKGLYLDRIRSTLDHMWMTGQPAPELGSFQDPDEVESLRLVNWPNEGDRTSITEAIKLLELE